MMLDVLFRIRRAWSRELQQRTGSALAALLVTCALVPLVLWSCQSVRKAGHTDLMYGSEPEIRVRLLRARTVVELEARTIVATDDARTVSLEGPVLVHAGPRHVSILDRHGHEHIFVEKAVAMTTGTPTLDGEPASEVIEFLPRDDGTTMDVVGVMPMEDYIAGVVTSELYGHWSLSTFRAQAVVARTYALHERARARERDRDWDVVASTIHQAYDGPTTFERALEAVASTKGMVVYEPGVGIVRTYYSSTCGGRPSSAGQLWPTRGSVAFNASPTLQGTDRGHWCDEAPYFRWSVRRDVEDLAGRLRAWGRFAGHPVRRLIGLESIEVDALNDFGRPTRYALLDSTGARIVMTAEEFRVASNQQEGAEPLDDRLRLRSNDLAFEFDGDVVVIEGRGYGHGVGLCQYCAEGLGRQHESWDRIVLTFYPGAGLVRAY